jgi:hypothetical protein
LRLRKYSCPIRTGDILFDVAVNRGDRTSTRLCRAHLVEDRVLVVGTLQVVVRDARAEVVHVVQADVPREELQHLRQLEVGAAPQRRVGIAPVLVLCQ